jgi:hypothetical protein
VTGHFSLRSLAILDSQDYRPVVSILMFHSYFSLRASTSGTSFRGVALAVDCFVGAASSLPVDTPLSARDEEGLCKDRRVC